MKSAQGVATDLSVVIPFTSTCPHRVRAAEFVVNWWRVNFPDATVLIGGEPSDGPWVKARHVDMLMRSVDTPVVAVADADVILENPEAVRVALDNLDGWAIPHLRVVRWDEGSTAAILDGREPSTFVQSPYIGFAGGGITILPTDTYRSVPLDPRFQGWGQEDESWACALRCLVGEPWRGEERLWHLWHPPQQRRTRRWGSQASKRLAGRYKDAESDLAAMRALLDEVTR